MVAVIDVVGEVLDSYKVKGPLRVAYRLFAKKLITLWRKGRVHVRVRTWTEVGTRRAVSSLEGAGLKPRACHRSGEEGATVTATCRSEEEVVRAFVAAYKLRGEVLQAILRRLKEEERIVAVI